MRVALGIAFVLVTVTLACGRRSAYYTAYPPVQAPVATPLAPTSIVPTPKPIPNSWTDSEIQSEVYGCVQTAAFRQQLNADELQNTTSACRCIFDAASVKWSYTTYRGQPNYYLGELERLGVIEQCSTRL